MSFRFDTPIVASAFHLGNRGLGVLGSTIPSTGDNGPSYMYNDLSLPADNDKEYKGFIETPPASGTFFAYEDGSFDYTGPSGSFVYRLFEDGVDKGTGTVTLNMSSTPVATIGWAEQNDAFASTGALRDNLSLAWTDADDVYSISSNVASGTNTTQLSWTESNDVFALSGNVSSASISGSLGWVDANDTFSVQVTGSLSASNNWSEASDTFSINAAALIDVTMSVAWIDSNDLFNIVASVPVTTSNIPSKIKVKFHNPRYKIKFNRE